MAHPSDPRLLLLHTLRLKGFVELDGGPELDAAKAEGLVTHREGRISGWSLTPVGRKEHERLLADELDRAGARRAVEEAYGRFLELNQELLSVCTDWQLRSVDGQQVVNDHTDAAHDTAVLDRLTRVDEGVQPVVADLADHLARFGAYGARLANAVERLRAGEVEWLTKPLIDSYHTVWFELHEDLLATLGRERSSEGEA